MSDGTKTVAINTALDNAGTKLLQTLSTAVMALINSSGIETAVKDALNGNIKGALIDLEGGIDIPTVEKDVGAVAESTADAAITAEIGPFSGIVVPIANQLLNALGGKLEDAINALLGVHATNTGQTVSATVVTPDNTSTVTVSPQ